MTGVREAHLYAYEVVEVLKNSGYNTGTFTGTCYYCSVTDLSQLHSDPEGTFC